MSLTVNQQALVETARLLGRLLLREIDAELRQELLQPELAGSLRELGLDVTVLEPESALDELAAEYFEEMVHPDHGGPLVQSLWTAGTYESDHAVAVRKLAEYAGLEFDREASRGAAQDHLGALLQFWAEATERVPEVAERIEAAHLDWALPPLARLAERPGFYGQLGRLVAAFVVEIRSQSVQKA